MKRRSFLGGLGVAGLVGFSGVGCATVDAPGRVAIGRRELIELKLFNCADATRRAQLMQIFDDALLPALRRQGVGRVGLFWTDTTTNGGKEEYNNTLFLVVPHATPASWLLCEERLLQDKLFMRQAEALFNAPMQEPLYDSSTSSLLRGFATCPQVKSVSDSPERILQLRIYNSYNIERNAAKIAMFEEGGELAIFRECNMQPIFFGAGVAGAALPNLTYMLGFADKATQTAAWKRFREHPAWLKLRVDPLYKDTANKITNIELRPSRASRL